MIKVLWRACHPLPATAVTVLSGALAWGLGRPWGEAALAAGSIGLTQLSIGWANDAIDAGRDRAVGRADKPLATRVDAISTVKWAAWVAAAATLIAAAFWGWPRGLVLVLALAGAQLYNWPLKSTVASIVPYLVCFAALPAFLAPNAPLWLILAAALLGGSAHLLNVIPDLEADRVTGVHGLPHRLGARLSLQVASILMIATTVVLVAGARPPWWASAVALVSAVSLPFIGWYSDPRTTFRAVILVAAVDVALIVISGAL